MSEQPRRRRRQQIVIEEPEDNSVIEEEKADEPIPVKPEKAERNPHAEHPGRKQPQKKTPRAKHAKEVIAVSVIVLLVAIIAGLAVHIVSTSSPAGKYRSAQELMAKGQYDQAAEKFENLGSYEDATTLAMYCKACALCESGSYETGLAAFETLGDFKDSAYRMTYYTARAYEDLAGDDYWEYMQKAQSLYKTIPVFLDSTERITTLNEQIKAAKTAQYNAAVEAGESGNYDTAQKAFNRLGSYSDSEKRYTYYGIRKEEANLNDSSSKEALIAIADKYTDMGDYLDCADRASSLTASADQVVAARYAKIDELIDEGEYAAAESQLAAFGKYGNGQVTAYYYLIAEKYLETSQWDNASAAFKKAGTYSDAAERISEPYYKQAEMLLAEEKWDEASAAFRKAGTYSDAKARIYEPYYVQGLGLMGKADWNNAIEAFEKAKFYKDSAAQITACKTAILDGKYDAAVALMNAGKYSEAYEAFIALNEYKDSATQGANLYLQFLNPELKNALVGSYITFGTYEQDGDASNGKEDIEWLVLAKENNRLLVISRYGLDCQPYNKTYEKVTWETCTLRQWLNNDFLNAAFSSAEQAMIPTVTVTADKNPDYSTDPGNATQDKGFLLSIVEAGKYFPSDSAGQCAPTAYAEKQGAYTDSSGSCRWWLRSPGYSQTNAAYMDYDYYYGVYESGEVVTYGVYVAVRPALWIDLEL